MNTFYLVYQPKVRDGKIIAVEALLRPLKTDMTTFFNNVHDILSLDKRVILEFCREACEYNLRYPVSLNIHPASLLDDDFVDFCISMLSDRLVTLELIETQSIKVCDQLRYNVERLKSHNIKISIDDFCFEYSRLDLAIGINTDEIKFDGSLIEGIENSFFKFKYLVTLYSRCSTLGIENIVFEMVETKIQYDLINIFCENAIMQGFYFYKPMRMESLVRENLTICDAYSNYKKTKVYGGDELDFLVYNHIANCENYSKKTVNDVIKKFDKTGAVYNQDDEVSTRQLREIYFNSDNAVNNVVMNLFYNADRLLVIRNDQGVVVYDNLAHREIVGQSLIGKSFQEVCVMNENYMSCINIDNQILARSDNMLTTKEVFGHSEYGVVREKIFYNDRAFIVVNAAEPDANKLSSVQLCS